jgi:signal transduction histidine kinase
MGPLFHTIDTYLALAVALLNFVYAILVMARTSRMIFHQIFFFICVCNVIWNFGDFMFFVTGLRSWLYFSLIGSSFLPALMFHFVRILVAPQRKITRWIVPAYTFSGLLAISAPLAFVNADVRAFVDSVTWNHLYLVLLGPFLIIAAAMLIRALRRATSDNEKTTLRYILAVVLIGVTTGLTDLVQLMNVPIPPLGHLGSLLYSSILTYGVLKHREAFDVLAEMRNRLQMMSEMAASIAHEIRNPLTSIKAATNLIKKELKLPENAACEEYFSIVTEEIDRLHNILSNFQYYTRPIKVEKEDVSMERILQRTVRLAETDIPRLRICVESSDKIPSVRADASLIRQVFLNLIKNAGEACGSDGKLLIRMENASPFLKISFTDNGPGIPQELMDRIFEPFFTTKTSGMGVGLAISQRIIQAHGGRIEVKNLIPKGTRFSVFLPM